MLYLLPAGPIVDLHDEFTSDGIIIFRSATLDLISARNTSINLYNGDGDIVLHIVFRREAKKIVFNTHRSETSTWEREEHVGFEGKFNHGQDTTVTIYDHRDRFQILVNYRTIHYFKKRFPDNVVTAIAYRFDGPQSLFSEYLTVDTYPCLANLLPRSN